MDRKSAKLLGLALSLPSTILFMAYGTHKLVEMGIFSKIVGILIFLAIVVNIIITMVYYAYKKKNKS